jgi:hypothetical protein
MAHGFAKVAVLMGAKPSLISGLICIMRVRVRIRVRVRVRGLLWSRFSACLGIAVCCMLLYCTLASRKLYNIILLHR